MLRRLGGCILLLGVLLSALYWHVEGGLLVYESRLEAGLVDVLNVGPDAWVIVVIALCIIPAILGIMGGIALFESLSILAKILSRTGYNIEPLTGVMLLERGLWMMLAVYGVIALLIASTYGALKLLAPLVQAKSINRVLAWAKGFVEPLTTNTRWDGNWYLNTAILIIILSILLPHTRIFNPSMSIVSTDTLFNLKYINDFREDGFLHGFKNNIGALRPLYLIFIYIVWKLSPIPEVVLFDVVLPTIGLMILSLSVYYLSQILNVPNPGAATLFSMLYWTPFFVIGGFHTNLYGLSMGLVAYARYLKGDTIGTSVLLFMLSLWHPWTLIYILAGMTLFSLSNRSFRSLYASLSASLLGLALLLALLYVTGKPSHIGNLVNTMAPSKPVGKLSFILYVYLWSSVARPEILVPGSISLIARDTPLIYLIIPSLGFILLSPVPAFRLLMIAPIPLALGYLRKEVAFPMLFPAIASWTHLILNAPPI